MQKLNLCMDLRNKNQQYIITKISEIFPGLEHIYAKLHRHYLTCQQFFLSTEIIKT